MYVGAATEGLKRLNVHIANICSRHECMFSSPLYMLSPRDCLFRGTNACFAPRIHDLVP